jgi:hypothetical protein
VVAFKWTGVLIAVVSVALDGLANLLLATLTTHKVPSVFNAYAVGLATIGLLVAFLSYLYERIESRFDYYVKVLLDRFEETENRIGDRNSGFAEGYMMSHAPEAPVIPLAPRGLARRAMSSDD